MTNQEKENKEILLRLVKATSHGEVTKLIENHDFFKKCGWRPYGDHTNNAGIIKAQAPDSIGALVEKITNGIDALLVRHCCSKGIDPTSLTAPQCQNDAVKVFYGKRTANFELSPKEIRNIAAETVRITAEGDKEKPTISVIDFGEGQHPKDFPSTFLSIGHSNKIKIKFAHGIYNQGGSATLKFCEKGYQLILSRKAPDMCDDSETPWGFSLIRERYEEGYRAEWYEYCTIGGGIPSFPYEALEILPDMQPLESGSFIRLFNYYLKNGNLFVTGQREKELAREINKRYLSMPLPIQINELRTHLRGWDERNKATRIYGLLRLLKRNFNDKESIRDILTLKADLGVFDQRDIEIVLLNDEGTTGKTYRAQQEKVFLTVNGQAQHTESVNFLKTKCFLPDLAPYMIVHIDLSNASHAANKIFSTNRKGIIEIPEHGEFQKRLIDSIKDDEKLKELNREYNERKLKNAQPEDNELSRYFKKLMNGNPLFKSFFSTGEDITIEIPDGPQEGFKGEYIPTIFELEKPEKEVPCNSYSRMRIKTNAMDDYLTRSKNKGVLSWSTNLVQVSSYSLKGGYLPVRIDPKSNATPGSVDNLLFELSRPNKDPLKASLKITIGEPKPPSSSPSGSKKHSTKEALKLPKREYVPKESWPDFEWTGEDIVKVEEGPDNITVYMNKEPDILEEFKKRNPRYSSADLSVAVQKGYFASVYICSIAMFFDMKNCQEEEKREEMERSIPIAMKSISKVILDLLFTSKRGVEQIEEA